MKRAFFDKENLRGSGELRDGTLDVIIVPGVGWEKGFVVVLL